MIIVSVHTFVSQSVPCPNSQLLWNSWIDFDETLYRFSTKGCQCLTFGVSYMVSERKVGGIDKWALLVVLVISCKHKYNNTLSELWTLKKSKKANTVLDILHLSQNHEILIFMYIFLVSFEISKAQLWGWFKQYYNVYSWVTTMTSTHKVNKNYQFTMFFSHFDFLYHYIGCVKTLNIQA